MVHSNNGTGKNGTSGEKNGEKMAQSENIRMDQVLSGHGHNVRF